MEGSEEVPGASVDGGGTDRAAPDDPRRRALAAARRLPVAWVLAGVVVLALLARVAVLGARSAHWDEARVAHWVVHYQETGHFAYRRIIHGPLIQHLTRPLFGLLGRTDAVIRLPVAVVGALLPATAYLFREHLDRDELVAMALFLAGNGVLLYYSRFMRSDVLVATFMFAALGTLVRYADTRRVRYLYATGVLVALGVGSKENAVVYLLTWLGGVALLADTGLYRPHDHRTGVERLRDSRVGRAGRAAAALALGTADGRVGDRARRLLPAARAYGRVAAHAAGAAVVFLAVVVVLFAPRGDGLAGVYLQEVPESRAAVDPGLWEALAQPAAVPGFAADTLGYTYDEFTAWFTAASDPGCGKDNIIDGYVCFLGRYLEVMRDHAALVGLFAVGGFLYERYARPRPRNLVMFAGYVGGVSVLGYPLGTDIFGAWLAVHAVVPLAVPAAVGVARLYRWGRDAALAGDDVGAAVVGLALLVVAAGVAVPAVGGVYGDHSGAENSLVQYAQPADDLDPLAADLERVAGGDDPDLVVYAAGTGPDSFVRNVSSDPFPTRFRPVCTNWPETLPLNWYIVAADANATCRTGSITSAEPVAEQLGPDGEAPAVVLAPAGSLPADLGETYDRDLYRIRTTDSDVAVYVRRDR